MHAQELRTLIISEAQQALRSLSDARSLGTTSLSVHSAYDGPRTDAMPSMPSDDGGHGSEGTAEKVGEKGAGLAAVTAGVIAGWGRGRGAV